MASLPSNFILPAVAPAAITAHAGGGQAAAEVLEAANNRFVVATVAAANDSVKFAPASTYPDGAFPITISNTAAANSCRIFPAVGEFINGGAVNVHFDLANGKTAIVYRNANRMIVKLTN